MAVCQLIVALPGSMLFHLSDRFFQDPFILQGSMQTRQLSRLARTTAQTMWFAGRKCFWGRIDILTTKKEAAIAESIDDIIYGLLTPPG
jgi:hypothetical protein